MKNYTDLNPGKRILMGPGPSDVHPRVLKAMSTPLVGHLDPDFLEIMNETRAMLKESLNSAISVLVLLVPISKPANNISPLIIILLSAKSSNSSFLIIARFSYCSLFFLNQDWLFLSKTSYKNYPFC